MENTNKLKNENLSEQLNNSNEWKIQTDVTSFTGNFEQYGLQSRYVDLVVADSAAPPWRQGSKLFDSIITDPPYGIREPTEKVGTTRKNPEVPKEFLDVHFPQKVNKIKKEVQI